MPEYVKEEGRLVYSADESGLNHCPVCGAEPDYERYEHFDDAIHYPWNCHTCGASGYEYSELAFKGHYVDVDTLLPDLRGQYAALKTQCINGPISVGDLVLSTIDENDFPCLPGRVIALELLGSEDHTADNETDDVHVDFTGDYNEQRKREIVGEYGGSPVFEDIRLDDIVMSPGCLIKITGISEEDLESVRNTEEAAVRFAYRVVRGRLDELEKTA